MDPIAIPLEETRHPLPARERLDQLQGRSLRRRMLGHVDVQDRRRSRDMTTKQYSR